MATLFWLVVCIFLAVAACVFALMGIGWLFIHIAWPTCWLSHKLFGTKDPGTLKEWKS